ncbi:MAG: hypothetical protein WD708_12575 [Kiritimatiellia bacterium]
MNDSPPEIKTASGRVHGYVMLVLQIIMGVELVFALFNQRWLLSFLILAIMVATALPDLLRKRFNVYIPPEFQILSAVFVFASLFLGEIRGFYTRFWWWDMFLHTWSGLLLGIFGFLLVYMLNENASIELSMKPRFVAFFAFLFAVSMGAIWEIFEFIMDQQFGMNMQKPMLGDPSGLTDTMWDLIVDTLGAGIISILGWWYLRDGKRSWFDDAIQAFVEKNPRMFSNGFSADHRLPTHDRAPDERRTEHQSRHGRLNHGQPPTSPQHPKPPECAQPSERAP